MTMHECNKALAESRSEVISNLDKVCGQLDEIMEQSRNIFPARSREHLAKGLEHLEMFLADCVGEVALHQPVVR